MRTLTSLLVTIFTTIVMAQAGKPTVAILDLESTKVDESDVLTLSERLRTEVGNTNAVRLIERKALENILQEQGFQQTGCTTDECAAEVGQLLGAQYMLSGTIGKIKDSYTIDIKLFSVETGESERTKSVTYKGAIDGLIVEMEILAWEIVGLEAPTKLKLKREGSEEKSTLAVMDFEGRGITLLEARTLTDRLITELARTKRVLMVERNTMNDVLNEQGYETEGCMSDECAAEVGALLGVDLMINGSVGKIGNTYTIDAKMFKVSTGAAENMKNITYQGPVDGLIVEIEILAWQILDLSPPRDLIKKKRDGVAGLAVNRNLPKTKSGAALRSLLVPGFGQIYGSSDKLGWGIMGVELVIAGLAFKAYNDFGTADTDFNTSLANYNQASTIEDISKFKSETLAAMDRRDQANSSLQLFSAIAGVVWGGSILHAFMVDPEKVATKKSKKWYYAYDPVTKNISLGLRIPS